MARKNILLLNGDGIGPELLNQSTKVVGAVGEKYRHIFDYEYAAFGAGSYFDNGSCFPDKTKALVQDSKFDGILKGPVGLDKAGSDRLRELGVKVEHETVIELRRMLDSYACYRPVFLPKAFADFSPLKREIIGDGIDMLMMRELTGGIYFGKKIEGKDTGMKSAFDECTYTREQVERFAHVCFREAQQRGVKLTNIHKANVKATGRFWNAIFTEVSKQYPNVKLEDCLVDSFATGLCTKPTSYNGVVSLENMEGDIITDQAGGIIGSLGLMPSACWNPETKRGYFEPSHGSAPDIAGQNKANPYSMIGSLAYMLDMAFGMKEESQAVWSALTKVFADGFRTSEISKSVTSSKYVISTSQFGDLVVKNILGRAA
jgi:3-isopropylmalate dehydrogenase